MKEPHPAAKPKPRAHGRRKPAGPAPAFAELDLRAPLGSGGAGESETEALIAAEPRLKHLLSRPSVHALVSGAIDGSPYLFRLITRDPERLVRILETPPALFLKRALDALSEDAAARLTTPELKGLLRQVKAEMALALALQDLSGVADLSVVTTSLTRLADRSLRAALAHLFAAACARGDWLPDPAAPGRPELTSGFFILGMGKYGADELNYSSDIDLIVFYDAECARVRPGLEPLTFYVRLVRDLVKLIAEPTGEGYVFRVDLRLRPDAGATQSAISTAAALNYYESFGQNWERAALIKARVVAGDMPAGSAFLDELKPFIWRRTLDYAAIADIHAMKRQIHAYKGFGEIGVHGHDLKIGRGGIREIEFFVQTQQLIAGGRQPDLRVSATMEALDALARRGWIGADARDQMKAAYVKLRGLEHRLQMVNDEQTHRLPSDPDALRRFARFSGYLDTASLAQYITRTLQSVQAHFVRLFEDEPSLTAGEGNLVLAGESDDQETLARLSALGFSQPANVLALVRGWHHGRYAAVRSAAARERLTIVQPLLIEALAKTSNPDAALAGFDRFLSQLPSGVQLFSLLRANPPLLNLIADIMGTAPRLAGILSRHARLLDAVIDPRTALPSLASMASAPIDLTGLSFEDALDAARIEGSERGFLIGVRLLQGAASPAATSQAYAALADRMIDALARVAAEDTRLRFGQVPGAETAVVALGKLGGREMTATSDLDLIVIYDVPEHAGDAIGPRPMPPAQLFARQTQRLVTALSTPTAEGKLYEVDLRLRPSGQKGPLATQLSSFMTYQANEAWTWEHMALTRARVVSAPPPLRLKVEAVIRQILCRPRDPAKVIADVREMRALVATEKGHGGLWDLKLVPGGLLDIEFIAQGLELIHAARTPHVLSTSTITALERLAAAGHLDPAAARTLSEAARLYSDLTQILRLCVSERFEPKSAPEGLCRLLAQCAGEPDFRRVEERLRDAQAGVLALFDEIIGRSST